MYTTLTSSNPPTLMLGELRFFISLFPTSWNKLSNILHVFLIAMTMELELERGDRLVTAVTGDDSERREVQSASRASDRGRRE